MKWKKGEERGGEGRRWRARKDGRRGGRIRKNLKEDGTVEKKGRNQVREGKE